MATTPKARVPKRAGILDGLDMQRIEIHEDAGKTKCVGTIAMITRDKVSAPTAISMMMIDQTFLKPEQYFKKYILVGNVLTFQRNQSINDMEGDWIILIDSDMTWQPDAVKTLIETQQKFDLDIVGGLCFQRGDPYQPTLYVEGNNSPLDDSTWSGYTFLENWDDDTAVEVDATGMAFVLIHRRVFDRILQYKAGVTFGEFEDTTDPETGRVTSGRKNARPAPFFRWEESMGEDFLFCREAKQSGSRIFVDTAVKIGHVGEQIITEETFLRELAFRDPEATKVRSAVLESLGHKTRSREDALARLGWKE